MATLTERPGVPSYREKPLRIATVQYDAKVSLARARVGGSDLTKLTELTAAVGTTAQGRRGEHQAGRGDAQRVRVHIIWTLQARKSLRDERGQVAAGQRRSGRATGDGELDRLRHNLPPPCLRA
jgi:hypothetical protein